MDNVLYATFHPGIQIVYIFYQKKITHRWGCLPGQIITQRMDGNDDTGADYRPGAQIRV